MYGTAVPGTSIASRWLLLLGLFHSVDVTGVNATQQRDDKIHIRHVRNLFNRFPSTGQMLNNAESMSVQLKSHAC